MFTIVITAFKEPKTIANAITSITNQKIKEKYKLIVSAPDRETLDVARKLSKKNKKINVFKDPGKGKSFALNLLLPKLRGDIVILTDGDVYVSSNSINEMLKKFKDKKVGCVTGRPVPEESKKTKYGYWANFLFDAAHKTREIPAKKNQFLECSGYLWGFRNKVIKKIPLDVAEDTIVPYFFWEKGYKIAYAPKAKVYVKNVRNWDEWISQKTRTTRAHETLDKYVDVKKTPRTKSFSRELRGVIDVLLYPKTLKQFLWSFELLFARLYMWVVVFNDVYIRKKYHKDKWERVESTK